MRYQFQSAVSSEQSATLSGGLLCFLKAFSRRSRPLTITPPQRWDRRGQDRSRGFPDVFGFGASVFGLGARAVGSADVHLGSAHVHLGSVQVHLALVHV